MFTGLVEGLGFIRKIALKGGGLVLSIEPPFSLEDVRIGDSVAINGACLTVVALEGQRFEVEVSPETLRRTTLGELRAGDRVNLERALRLGDRLGGHLVTGHVDGIGRVVYREHKGNFWFFRIWAPPEVSRYLVEKGSVAVDGVSLTVNKVLGEEFELAVIPHTASLTTLGFRKVGSRVNLEADLLAKYVEKFLAPYRDQKELSEDFLKESGFF